MMTGVMTSAAGIGLPVTAQPMRDRLGGAGRVCGVAVDLDACPLVAADGRDTGPVECTAVFGTPTWAVHRAATRGS